MNKDDLSKAFLALAALVSRLRGPGGCPWDVQQTYDTIKTYLLEEAYEVLDAVESGSPEDVCHELGDLLFQILFLASIAEERGEFDLLDVLEEITKKMINRHPHVFGRTPLKSAEEVAENWEKIKRREMGAPENSLSLLQKVPVNFPALLRAHRLSERASKMGPEASDGEEIWGKVKGGLEALGKSMSGQDKAQIGDEIGHLLFCLADLARHWGLNGEHLLRKANEEFLQAFEETGEVE
ncbi:MAG: nucleoside triphosphate pyrophosphohydrolase [Desulfobacteraceae bacterium]|jgi:MazG family protein